MGAFEIALGLTQIVNETPPDLSVSLAQVVAFELARGNSIARIDQPAGSRCPLAVIFARPLDTRGYAAGSLVEGISTWENHDGHYPLEAGYMCERTRHAVAGPL